MNTKSLETRDTHLRPAGWLGWWVLAVCLLASAALIVVAAAQPAPAGRPAHAEGVEARLNTAVNAESLRAHPNLHSGVRAAIPVTGHGPQMVPDAATQGVLNYLRAHGANVP